jgi:hypothetical protein
MKDGLQDTVAPLHPNVLVPVFVIVEFWHRIPSWLFDGNVQSAADLFLEFLREFVDRGGPGN